MTRWGIGLQIAGTALTYAAIAGAATHQWPDVCRVRFVPDLVIAAIAGILLLPGVTMLVIAVRSFNRAHNRNQLVTSGVFALVRHPVYSAWIVFILPGLAVFSRSWPLLLMPVVAYAVFKRLIHREDDYLRQRFGEVYLHYRARVHELFPIPRY